ncbi:riboflavin synthase [Anaerotignum neopropionicum]|uniref:Riboflavin synthase n=1 Tax=Anaerotignum neopropionicum TaxID=36847 RepID=A0A136WC86_9FIRM|nr:riboflavin synthase [Anaerotignum neopropionicum]KXL52056.1 riboflavin synthase [Anaerotignum neopropionicum]
MFTGLIEEIGVIDKITSQNSGGQLVINAKIIQEGAMLGDSIAVNGVCLTVTNLTKTTFTADVMPETLKRSNLGSLKKGAPVHLERAMAANGRFGGHMVSGHIDGTGIISAKKQEGNAIRLFIQADAVLLRQIIEKGSIAIDGVSLTVISVDQEQFSVGIIPHTGTQTTLLDKKTGDKVNLETDIIAKYIQRFLENNNEKQKPLTLEFLRENGF